MKRTENRRDFLRFNDGVQRARVEYALLLNELDKTARPRPDCGTVPAFKRHIAHGEEPCRPCIEADKKAARKRAARKRRAG
jgi:hypothetical protein